ncbi:hypothetical protein FJTKL_09288 [Diaporthe vaccinii]|uniref:Uncharacterized protein n=1 Tax=Diaporthe vaccinii TaxID=105482 RepID=A0ABR4ENS0_9PEZI
MLLVGVGHLGESPGFLSFSCCSIDLPEHALTVVIPSFTRLISCVVAWQSPRWKLVRLLLLPKRKPITF